MKLQFKIGAEPPTTTAITALRDRAERAGRLSFWLGLPTLALALYLAYLTWSAFCWLYQWPSQQGTLPTLFQGFSAVLGVFGVFSGTIALYVSRVNYWRDVEYRLRPIDASQAERALALVKQNDELDTYRIAVVATRQLVNEDLEAMEAYIVERNELEMLTERRERQEAVLQALHKE